jgi:cyclopropane-fatty-acyl-phospholipid synthase
MNAIAAMTRTVERLPLPDRITRAGIALLIDRTRRKLVRADAADEAGFAASMTDYPIALHVDAANEQHYELPPDFFELILGPRRKYSCCLYEGAASLAEAEEVALAETARHADLADGQRILELGCGWGSLSLWMAERYPAAEIVAVSNSQPQRAFIEAEAARRGVRNLRVVTADMNEFAPQARFDRVVSVEMFEHISNWTALLRRIHAWLAPGGRVFLHVFSHCSMPYRFDHRDRADWIAQHFFTGGVMPSHGLIRHLPIPFTVEADWRWNGTHYRRTAEDWLVNYDANAPAIGRVLRDVYGADAPLWRRRWRLFFLATAHLFGDSAGTIWGVSHYRLQPR